MRMVTVRVVSLEIRASYSERRSLGKQALPTSKEEAAVQSNPLLLKLEDPIVRGKSILGASTLASTPLVMAR
ncbi:hypothetical protein Tco_1227226 [Tanacetum coccineum]